MHPERIWNIAQEYVRWARTSDEEAGAEYARTALDLIKKLQPPIEREYENRKAARATDVLKTYVEALQLSLGDEWWTWLRSQESVMLLSDSTVVLLAKTDSAIVWGSGAVGAGSTLPTLPIPEDP